MRMVSTAELKNQTNKILNLVSSRKRPVVITKNGVPFAVVEPFTEADIEDIVFQYGHEVMVMAKESERDIKTNRLISMKDFASKHGIS